MEVGISTLLVPSGLGDAEKGNDSGVADLGGAETEKQRSPRPDDLAAHVPSAQNSDEPLPDDSDEIAVIEPIPEIQAPVLSEDDLKLLSSALALSGSLMFTPDEKKMAFAQACATYSAIDLKSPLTLEKTLELLICARNLIKLSEVEATKAGDPLDGFKESARSLIEAFGDVTKKIDSLADTWSKASQTIRSSSAVEDIWAKFLSVYPNVGKALKDKIPAKTLKSIKGIISFQFQFQFI